MPELPMTSRFTLINTALLGIAVLVLFLLRRVFAACRPKTLTQTFRLPPGPKGLPLVGNLFDLPKPGSYQWRHWARHKDLYGPISSVTVFGQPVIILNDRQIAVDLFEKRSATYSDRSIVTFAGEMCGWNDVVTLERYSPDLQTMRRHIHQFMGTPRSMERFHDVLLLETRRFLLQIHRNPEKLYEHIRIEAGAIILNLTYGYKIDRKAEDPLVRLAEETIDQAASLFLPGTWIVDSIPALRYIPDWFPGAKFKSIAKDYLRTFTDFKEIPHAFVKQRMSEGSALPSFTADLLERHDPADGNEALIKRCALSLFAGGAETTVSTLYSFFLAMALYPDVQKKAQEEIDLVVGSQRLPAFSDSPDLPYVDGVIKETHRWNPVVPMGFAHVTSEDDVYEGHFIPKGVPVIPNVWQFTHDPAEYHDPMIFMPERYFVGSSNMKDRAPERDPREVTFGFGRRICPGQELVNASFFIAAAMVLAVFDIKPPKDADGREVKPHYEFSSGFLSHPERFECIIIPRSDRSLELINAVEKEHPLDSGDAEKLLCRKGEAKVAQ